MEITQTYTIPDFFIAGAAKSGTTALWNYLGQHPDILMTTDIANKELGYFCNDYGINSLENYSSHFESAKPGQLIGEVCHAYLTSPEAPALIFSANPAAKIILILRNPYDRLKSLYQWMVQNGYEPLSLEGALKRELSGIDKTICRQKYFHSYFRNYQYIESGFYSSQIDRFRAVFPENQIKVFLFDDLHHPLNLQQELFQFLGIQGQQTSQLNQVNMSRAVKNARMYFFVNNIFIDFLSRLRMGKRSKELIRNRLNSFNFGIEAPQLPQVINDVFNQDIKRTASLINRDLSHWIDD